MSHKVYIQQVEKQFPDDWLYAAWLGFDKLGYEIIFFEDINEVPANQMVVAFIEDTLKYLGDKTPSPLNIPLSLSNYSKRTLGTMSMGLFKQVAPVINFPIFIKPNAVLKQFPSGILKDKNSLHLTLSDVADDVEIFISEVVDMDSEYRCFVHKDELVGIQWYAGDFTLFPDTEIIKEAIKTYEVKGDAPIAYTIDFAVNYKGQTLLIECNDAFSIGNYGLDAKIYAKMLRDRWIEIKRNYEKSTINSTSNCN